MYLLVRWALLAGFLLTATAWWERDELPEPRALRGELREDPLQVAVQRAPFQTTVGGVTYSVRPLYSYDISGLVVSMHDSDSWWDWIHKAWNDRLNVVDLCVIYGENARSGGYLGLNYSSGEFVCNVSTSSTERWQAFSMPALSNNHLLADSPALASRLRQVRVGDQVRIRGYLAEYSHSHGFAFFRGTSTTRLDTGNGACETIYVEDFEVLRRGSPVWRGLFWVGLAGIALSVLWWFMLPPVMND